MMSVPMIIKVIGALAGILVINHLCRRLLPAVAGGIVILAVWCGFDPYDTAVIVWQRIISQDFWMLMLIVCQVIWLSSQMRETGVMKDLVAAARARLSRRGAMAVLPAIIGFLPMPGGALFSAPLVGECDPDGEVEAGLKAQTNHWFRHPWETWWPLYPGVLLATQLTGFEVWQMALMGIPLSAVSIAAGYFFLLRKIGQGVVVQDAPFRQSHVSPVSLIQPIIVVVLVYAAVKTAHAFLLRAGHIEFALNRYVPMSVGLLGAMLVLQKRRRLDGACWKKILLSKTVLEMAVIVAMVRVYGAFIEADLPNGTPLVAQMRAEMLAAGIPVMVMLMVMPFVSGLTTGLAIGFVGASFPIVLNLLGHDPAQGQVFTATVLAYASGYIGMMLSPVHVCLIMSSSHFETNVMRNAVALIRPGAVVLAASVVLYLLYGLVLA